MMAQEHFLFSQNKNLTQKSAQQHPLEQSSEWVVYPEMNIHLLTLI